MTSQQGNGDGDAPNGKRPCMDHNDEPVIDLEISTSASDKTLEVNQAIINDKSWFILTSNLSNEQAPGALLGRFVQHCHLLSHEMYVTKPPKVPFSKEELQARPVVVVIFGSYTLFPMAENNDGRTVAELFIKDLQDQGATIERVDVCLFGSMKKISPQLVGDSNNPIPWNFSTNQLPCDYVINYLNKYGELSLSQDIKNIVTIVDDSFQFKNIMRWECLNQGLLQKEALPTTTLQKWTYLWENPGMMHTFEDAGKCIVEPFLKQARYLVRQTWDTSAITLGDGTKARMVESPCYVNLHHLALQEMHRERLLAAQAKKQAQAQDSTIIPLANQALQKDQDQDQAQVNDQGKDQDSDQLDVTMVFWMDLPHNTLKYSLRVCDPTKSNAEDFFQDMVGGGNRFSAGGSIPFSVPLPWKKSNPTHKVTRA
jgi:hypothetical protein